ncbi:MULTISPECIES: winged helix-turn-helix transcriptional regulator [unclassified Pseudodesulfovibrio]|uniref:winged helix-turn-helix transcriptional regulator n=1 Tax=unclassified Pseudodesulfovibrio TaxID=2661612 RepID=UPI000FEBD2F5|nr:MULTISPECIES: winged helix-turn-helix transcriptional regulator [unclassified Pseudodesulfovibrio]MCJ2164335.1 winged helix-turn-helix transcriptional regulator [Pseudodesulfovibrio sp. S3-i]RWU04545.1 winged helix-turn-helix transcriptional regulator [Pseudodesulfovibrio sp. S3]
MADQFQNVATGMLITNGLYLKPSKSTRVLAILDALSRDSSSSQFELGRQLNLSGAMVNQYLKQLQGDGLVEFFPINGKSYHYTLTERGEQARRKMFSDYSSETVRLYSTIKEFVLDKLKHLNKEGKRRLALFGASETCEVVLSALRGTPFQVMILLDNDTKKQGQIFNGHVVSAPHVLDQVDCDAVVITSFGKQGEIFEQLKPYSEKRGFQIVRF